MSDPRILLERVARGYRARRAGAAALLVAGVAAGAAGIARVVPAAVPRWALVAIAIGAALLIAVRALRRAPGPATIARHLDRTEPALEESTELLLAEPAGLGIADRLERERAARALAARPPALRHLPDRTARGMTAAGAAGIVVALAAAAAGARGPVRVEGGVPREPAGTIESAPPRVRRVLISVAPPRYTGLPVRRQDEWELDVEAGARLTWSIELDRPAPGMRLVLSTGDTVPLAARGSTVSGGAIARAPALYQLVWGDEGGEYHRLLVRPDEAPSILVLRPAPRTTIPTGAARRVPVEALARDDHAIGDAALVATVTTGAGEGVRFRELHIPLGPGVRRPDGVRFRRTLDLDSLGMAPGDELYFHALARDTRDPRPGEGRSETVFIALADTATAAPAEFGGLALSVLPEYFRSQRQVIIDTERLVADSARLPADIVRERANAIGMDQGLLRLRYGAFTGEEFESSVEPGDAHQHDSEESATLLAPATKATLKGAIAEMWEAELRLRTYRPREALPFERRALELLKSVQQASRSYVQRVGFAPPPLDPGRTRLSGKLDGIRNQQSSDTVVAPPGQPAIETALARARELASGRPAGPADVALLEGAAGEIARQPAAAAETAVQLDAVRAVRAYAMALESGRPCPGCADAAVRALAGRLARPPRSAAPRAPASPLARRYLELLDTP
jgi:hypothetical protein